MTTRAEWIHAFDQATGAFRNMAEVLGAFRQSLLDEGFTEEGAEELADRLFDLLVATDR